MSHNLFALGDINKTSDAQKKPQQLKTSFQKVRSGDTLIAVLKRHGFNSNQRTQILRQKVFSENFTLIPGEKYRVATTPGKKFKELKFYELPTDNVLLFWRQGDQAGSASKNEEYTIQIKSIKGKIKGSILASINAHTRDDFVAQRFMDAYALDYKLTRQVQRGAKFSATYEEKYDGAQFIGTGEVIETSLEILGKVDRRKFVVHDDGGSFITDRDIHKSRPLYSPVDYMRITSHYNSRRKHPITKRRTPHLGVDFELPQGEDLYASARGRVLRFGRNRAAGFYVVLKHSGGLETYYNHLESIDSKVKKGATMRSGQRIGAIGCTGYCTKPHLHFALKKRGRFVNPIPFLKSYPFGQKELIGRKIASLKFKKPKASVK